MSDSALSIMRIYERMIVMATKCSREDAALVEAWMRLEHSELDGLDFATFNSEARAGLDCVLVDRAASVRLAKSYGLVRD